MRAAQFTFRLTMYLPNGVPRPLPAFLLLNHRGTVASQVNLPFFPVDQILSPAGTRGGNFRAAARAGQ